MPQPIPETGHPLVSLRGVTKVFPSGVTALEGLDLDIRSGEFISLLGPSGCGKSTALRIIAGLSRPSSGVVTWPHETIHDHRHEIGFVFQDPTLMPWADVADNVWLPLRLRGISRDAARDSIAQSLALVGLSGFERAYPRELSGGMKMRVSIARALSIRPKLLLMDEPFAALDEIARFKLNDDLLKLRHDTGCTIVFVTHSVFESAYLSSRIALMTPRPGRIGAEIAGVAQEERGPDFRTSSRYADLCRHVSRAMIDVTSNEDHRT